MTPRPPLTILQKLARPGRAGVLCAAVVLAALCVGAGNPGFLAAANLAGLLSTIAPIVIISLGLGMVVIAGEIDISVGSLYGTLAAVLAVLASPSHAGLPVWACVVIVIVVGALAGLINGVLTVWGRVPSIVATLGTMSILRGITEKILAGQWVTDLPANLRVLGTGSLLSVPVSVWVAGVVVVIATLLTRRTRLGVRLYAVGDHAECARMARVSIATTKLGAFALCGSLVGVAVLVSVPRLSVVESGLGVGLELAAVTAVVVGGVSIRGGLGSLAGVAAAAVLLGMVRTVLIFLKIGPAATYWEQAIHGACILAAVVWERAPARGAAGHVASGLRQPSVVPIAAVLAGVLGLAWWAAPEFLSPGVQGSLVPQVAEVALLAAAMAMVILTGGIDLSVGASMALSAVVAGVVFGNGVNAVVAAGAAVVTGAACGVLNGVAITRAGIHPLVVTLATLALYRGVAEGISGGRPVSGFPEGWTGLGTASLVGVPVVVIPAVIAAVVAAVFLARSTRGFALRATGMNETAARYCGLGVDGLKVLAYTLCGSAAGVAACVFIARRNTAKADIGTGIELDVITACVLGGMALDGGRGRIIGVTLGVVLIHEIRQLAAWKGYPDEVILITLGALLIGSVLFATVMGARWGWWRRFGMSAGKSAV